MAINLTEKQKELIEKMGVYSEQAGASPAQARITALLLVSDEVELTFEEIYETLQISKSAASNALNSLMATERVEYITKTGDRKRYFRSRISQWESDFGKRFNKLFEMRQLMSEILAQRTEKTVEFNANLKKIIGFMEFLQNELPVLHKKWLDQNQNK